MRGNSLAQPVNNGEAFAVIIRPAKNILGAIRLPGDKSISHRYAMLGAIAEGVTRLTNFSSGADCASTLSCVQQLGCEVKTTADGAIEITGRERLQQPSQSLDCGNSGSTMRMLSGILAGQDFECELHGDESLSRRPMGRVMVPLRHMGAEINAGANDRPPLRIRGGHLHAIEYTTPMASAQVKSAVLFAGLFADGETTVEEPFRTRDHSEQALRAFGVELSRSRNRVTIRGRQKLHAIQAFIPGDISSASFFLCAAALFPDSNLVLENLLLNPTRASLLDVLTALGARISVLNLENQHGELIGSVKLESGPLKGTTIAGGQSVALIDELPVLAAIAPYIEEGIEIRDAKELRVKESDRIAVVARNLRAMGAECEELEDGLRVPGNQKLHGAEIDSAGDHRIAMAFSVAALRAEGESVIHGADAARISYPEFFDVLEGIVER
ncbi:MAG: 3-phosphoshikimate 1-carboxyvinyltransferase [Candidatus Angelobacter sp. Gp1-AA117]|nr:MAG: 3-phosphoshikimate 1-carboxyvinyltransferase [Candidatus Angelobacter sp. Gp1-AA117]